MSARESNSIWQSLRSLVDPKTIPFLISQGVPRKLFPVATLLIGMILAFLWAYVVSPVISTAADPAQLSMDWKQEYVKQAAWQYAASRNEQNTRNQLSYLGNAPEVVSSLLAELQTDPAQNGDIIALVQTIQPFASDNPKALERVTPSLLNSNFTPVLCVLGLGILLMAAVIFNTIIPVSVLLQRRSTAPSTVTTGVHAERMKAQREAQERAKQAAAEAPAAESPAVALGTPVGRFMSTYIIGDDFYDDSFAIETASGEFLGETGVGISKAIGVGDPKKVTAFEVWVFDKNDIRTLTKVLMSEHAYNDEALRAELAPKGEAVLIRPGGVVMLDTQTLTVQARIIDAAYGTGALPPNSFLERFSVEVSAWPKKTPAAPPMPPAFGETGPN